MIIQDYLLLLYQLDKYYMNMILLMNIVLLDKIYMKIHQEKNFQQDKEYIVVQQVHDHKDIEYILLLQFLLYEFLLDNLNKNLQH